ncbi:ADP-ribosyl-(dinitrogen reductase) hydrolase [Polynucleobacter sp. MWH-UH24A]|uniref:ADP-ribosyl-(dinitrogen reductase) hydrolase n=1 Tax=Polynucleobacter sp. MWH-UH24A TaxID=2689110 RepID=UPI0020420B4F|nr:ADP-ribosyl-(dinitrogen reductase) hydrolase [Polynucleobacter sp. MWH-UH24A]
MMKQLVISPRLAEKLIKKHRVRRVEVEECFYNRTGIVLEDTRAEHQTEPPTVWFIAPTHQNRLLKIVYVLNDGVVNLKTAFEPNPREKLLYLRMALGDHL